MKAAARMTAATLEAKAGDFLALPRVAVVGVSRDGRAHPAGNAIFRRLKAGPRTVFAVNPHLAEFDGEPCYPTLNAIPGGVDGVVIVTSPDTTEAIVRQCGEAGIGHVWMHGSSAKGTSVSPAAVDYCHQAGIAVIAGACPLMFGQDVDLGHKCMRWMLNLSGGVPA